MPRGQGSSHNKVRSFYFCKSFRLALGPTQPPIQWVPVSLFPGVKWQGREADHSPPNNAEVRNVDLYIHSLICLNGIVLS
jgi:hypothetical protein